MNPFMNLGVDPHFIEKIRKRYIEKPTAIQNLVIPNLSAGKNIIFRSATGTGKTFAYLLPILTKLLEFSKSASIAKPCILIIAPTLELCLQIKSELDFLLEGTSVSSSILIGSVGIDRQTENLRKVKPDIIVGSPNRLLVLAKKNIIKFNNLRYLVLDEADRLTAQECIDETNELLRIIEKNSKHKTGSPDKSSNLPNICTAACSATINKKTGILLGSLFKTAEIIESSDHEILREKIEHWAVFSEKRRRDQTLRSLLSALKEKKKRVKALVFTSRGDDAGLVLSRLQHHHVSSAGLFGKLNKKPLTSLERKAALESFRNGSIEVLVSTDLAARGLDIHGITHVISLDVPAESDIYIHRCGRTGRAGKRGIMITIGDETQMYLLASIEKKLKIKIMPKELHYGKICSPQQIEDE